MIPVLGVPVLNRLDMLDAMLRSIDHPVGRLYVVDNGGVVPRDMSYANLPTAFVADTGYNVGVAASWNLIIRAHMHERWWLICNNDLVFQKGSLDRLVEDVEAHLDEPSISLLQMGNEDWGNHFGAFGINEHAVQQVGWFDENLHPIYWEDTDWKRRAQAVGCRMHVVPSTTQHTGNASWKWSTPLSIDNQRSWGYNVQYYEDKWRNFPDIDVTTWRPPSLEDLRKRAWRVR